MSRRRALVTWLRGVRDHLDHPLPDGVREEGVDDGVEVLEAEDVQLEAFAWVHKVMTGWEVGFIDLRPEEERQRTGIIEGAVVLSEGEAALERIGPVGIWVFYGEDDDATRAALHLRHQGHDDTWCLLGGFDAWVAEGGPVESGR